MLLVLATLALPHPSARPADLLTRAHTYSIVAHDSVTGDLGWTDKAVLNNIFARRNP